MTPFPLVWRADKQDTVDLSEFMVLSWASFQCIACFIQKVELVAVDRGICLNAQGSGVSLLTDESQTRKDYETLPNCVVAQGLEP